VKKNLTSLVVFGLGLTVAASAAPQIAKKEENRVSRVYRVQKGENLSKISERLFGDAKGWRSLWQANRKWISNPDSVKEGSLIYFTPGDDSHLPGVQTVETRPVEAKGFAPRTSSALLRSSPTLEDVLSLSAAGPSRSTISEKVAETAPDGSPSKSPGYPWGEELSPGKSEEWRTMPKQKWEEIEIVKPSSAKVDPLGFDRSNRVVFHEPKGLDPTFYASTAEIESAGEVTASPVIGKNLVLGEIIQIAANGDLALGETYSLMHEALRLKGYHPSEYGHAYPIAGKIKIIGNGDQGYIGVVLVAGDAIERGDFLIAEVPRIAELEPIAGPRELEAKFLVDPRRSTDLIAQHHFGFIDRGSVDGVNPGMIFRKYADRDPVNDDTLNRSDFTVVADIMVLQTSENYSFVKVVSSRDVLRDEDDLYLLTDVSQFRRVRSKVSFGEDEDDLDKLDDGRNLNPAEAQELQQLESAPAKGDEKKDNDAAPDFDSPNGGNDVAPDFDSPDGTPPTAPTPPANQSSLAKPAAKKPDAVPKPAVEEVDTPAPDFDAPNGDDLPPPP